MQRGYAVSGILYTILVLFMALMISFLYDMQNKKTILDKLKSEVVEASNCEGNLVSAKNRIDALQNDINEKEQKISDLESNIIGLSSVEKISLLSTTVTNTWKTVTPNNMSIYKWLLFVVRKTNASGEMYDSKTVVKYSDLKKYTSSSNYLFLQGSGTQDIIKVYWISDTSLSISTSLDNSDSYITMYGTNSLILDQIFE